MSTFVTFYRFNILGDDPKFNGHFFHHTININLNYAASAAISSFQAFPHRFLPKKQALSKIERLATPYQEAISHQSNR